MAAPTTKRLSEKGFDEAAALRPRKRAAHLYTDIRHQLIEAFTTRTGQCATALDADDANERQPPAGAAAS